MDELTFIGHATVFGQLIIENHDDAGVHFSNYFAVNYFTLKDDPRGIAEEIWFLKESN